MPLGVLKNKIIENQSDPEDLRSTSHIRHGTILDDHFDLENTGFALITAISASKPRSVPSASQRRATILEAWRFERDGQ